MAKQFRYSRKRLEEKADFINKFTEHKVTLFFGVGCYVTIDGVDYEHYNKRQEAYEGLKNKEVASLLKPLEDEALENALRKLGHK